MAMIPLFKETASRGELRQQIPLSLSAYTVGISETHIRNNATVFRVWQMIECGELTREEGLYGCNVLWVNADNAAEQK